MDDKGPCARSAFEDRARPKRYDVSSAELEMRDFVQTMKRRGRTMPIGDARDDADGRRIHIKNSHANLPSTASQFITAALGPGEQCGIFSGDDRK